MNRLLHLASFVFWMLFPKDRASLVAQMVKNPPEMQETWVRSLGWEDSPGEVNGYPLQYSCLFHGQRSLVGYSPWGGKESDVTEWLTFWLLPVERLVSNRMYCIRSGQKVKTKVVLGGLIQKPSETRSLATISCFLVILEVLDHLSFSVWVCLDVFGFLFEFFVPGKMFKFQDLP